MRHSPVSRSLPSHVATAAPLHRVRGLLAATLVALLLVAACGTSGGASGTASPYENPTSGALPSYTTARALVAAAGGDCAWEFTTTKRGDMLAGCTRDGILLEVFRSGGDAMSVEKLRMSEASPSDFCLWWKFMLLAYYVGVTQLRDAGASPSPSASPSRIPAATTGIVGANWVAFTLAQDAATGLAHRTGGYLVHPSDVCPSSSAS